MLFNKMNIDSFVRCIFMGLFFTVNVSLHSELNNNRFEVSHIHKVECVVPWLNDTLVFFTISLQLCQQLKDKVSFSPGNNSVRLQ